MDGHRQSKSNSILFSTPIDHNDIEYLLDKCEKDLLDDDEDNEVNATYARTISEQ